jgi:hypothetical protein
MTYFETIRVGEMDDLNNKQVIGMTCMPWVAVEFYRGLLARAHLTAAYISAGMESATDVT